MHIISLSIASMLTALTIWTSYQLIILLIGRRGYDRVSESPVSPLITILVPVKDEHLVIERCVNSILRQDYPKEKIEIIIIDGSESGKTETICSELMRMNPENLKFFKQKRRNGKPSALNEGLKHAEGEIIGVLDADSVAEKRLLRKVADKFYHSSDISAIQCRTISLNEEENYLSKLASKEEKLWHKTVRNRGKLGLFVPLTGSCQFIRTSIIRKLGGWNENALAEDMDLALRLVQNEHVIHYYDEAFSWQETPSTIGELVNQRNRWYLGCLQNLIRYGSLLRKPSAKNIDAEIVLIGPLLMALSSINFILAIGNFVTIPNPGNLTTTLSLVLTSVSLLLAGISLSIIDKPLKIKNLIWIPLIYLYWLLQSTIALWALIELLTGKEKSWRKTVKKGAVTNKIVLSEPT